MKTSTKIIGGAASAVALAISIAIWPDPVQPGDTPEGPEVVTLLPDGGLAYLVTVTTEDGGTAVRFTEPKCVRRWPGTPVNDCKRRINGMGGPIEIDQGDYVRFPEAQKVGTLCQPVACSVMAGDNPDLPEIDIAQNYPLEIPENPSM